MCLDVVNSSSSKLALSCFSATLISDSINATTLPAKRSSEIPLIISSCPPVIGPVNRYSPNAP